MSFLYVPGSSVTGDGIPAEPGVAVIPFIVVAGIMALASFFEIRQPDARILNRNPWLIVRNIIVLQFIFYICVALGILTTDSLAGEPFATTQIFAPYEYDSHTNRGKASWTGLMIGFIFAAKPVIYVIQHSRDMFDYSLTIGSIHMLLSIIGWGVASSGAWWLGFLLGFALHLIYGLYVGHKLETMAYRSSLGGAGGSSGEDDLSSGSEEEDTVVEKRRRQSLSSEKGPSLVANSSAAVELDTL